MFVTNGTPDWSSNRMYEDACELSPLTDKEMIEGYAVAVKEAFETKSVDGLVRYLKWLDGAHTGLGLVGSRGYVYQVSAMIGLLQNLSTGFRWNLLPRTGGFRSVAMHSVGL